VAEFSVQETHFDYDGPNVQTKLGAGSMLCAAAAPGSIVQLSIELTL
jgi:hypothetical protein